MANTTIPNLPSATSLTGSEQLEIVQAGVSVKTTTAAVAGINSTAGTVTQINTNLPITGGPITTTGTIGLDYGGVDNSYLADMPANTIKGNNYGNAHAPVDLTAAQALTVLGAAPLNSPYFTGNPRAPTPATSDDSVSIATTAYVKAQGYGVGTVYSITAGTGLTGGTITLSGTIAIDDTGVSAGSYGNASTVPVLSINAQGQITSATNTTISIPSGQVTGLGTMATQNANSVAITGGAINGTIIGGSTPAAATFTALTATGTTNLGVIASGTWNGTEISISYGGTGANNATTARSNLSAAKSGVNSDITSLTGLTTPLSAPQGGTGFGSYTTGDLLYADTSSTLARLNDVATGNVLLSGGVGIAPSYGKVGLTTHVSGVLDVANGGTGLSTLTSGGAMYATSASAFTTGTLPVTAGGSGATTLTGFLKGNGTSAFTAQATIGNSDLANSSITIGTDVISLGGSTLTLSGLTTVTVTQDPTSALQLSTKQYVDGQVSAVSNTTYHTAASYATTADLGTVIYSNGVGGVGATITNNGAQAALSIDGYTFTATDVTNATRVVVKNQTSGLQNGIYVVTNQGSGSTNWELTRSSDFNTVGTGPNYIQTGAGVFVNFGNLNGSSSWVMNTTGTITVGTTSLNWAQTSSSGNILVNSPLQKSGNTISLGTVDVAYGGTGLTTLSAYGLLYAPTSASVGQISPSATSGYALLSNGSSAAPSFGQVSLTAGVTGTLPTVNGGTGLTTFGSANYAIYSTSASALTAGTLPVAAGGTGTSTVFTTGSVVFAGSGGIYNQDAELFWDNTNKWLGVGTATPRAELTIVSPTQTVAPSSALPAGTDLYIVGADAANTRIVQDAYGTGNYPAYTGRQARGTAATPTASQTGDILAQYTGRGYGATAFASTSNARIDMEAAENFTDTAQGTYISMHTTALGAASPVERFRVGPSGQWGIGGGTYGTSGYAFVSGGASAAPTWSQISLTAGVTGTLPAANGGTGQSSYTIGDLLYADTSSSLAKLADVATGNVLLSGGVGVAPSWGKVDLTTAVSGTLPAANGGTGQSSYTVGDLLYASSSSALSRLADVATGSVLVSQGAGVAPAWSASPTLTTSLTVPTIYGGTGAASALTLQSTTGVGTTDSIVMKVGNNGATTAISIASSGIVTFPTTGAIDIPVGATGDRPTGATGMLRFNTTTTSFEGYNGTAWGSIGGGATGGGTDQIFWVNGQTVTTSYTIPASSNAGSFGPITVSASATVTVPASSNWVVV